jgi:hypothetical protein
VGRVEKKKLLHKRGISIRLGTLGDHFENRENHFGASNSGMRTITYLRSQIANNIFTSILFFDKFRP